MTPFVGRAIGLGFAGLWLYLGASALGAGWRNAALVVGGVAIAALVVRAWRMTKPRSGTFRMGRYRIAVVAEFAALALAGMALHRWRLDGYSIPVLGMIVGLHFIGLWWAGGGESYLWLAATMTAVDAGALLLPPGSAAMQAAAGLGSALVLAVFAGTRLGERR